MTDRIVYRLCEHGDPANVATLLRRLEEHATATELPGDVRLGELIAEMARLPEVYWYLGSRPSHGPGGGLSLHRDVSNALSHRECRRIG